MQDLEVDWPCRSTRLPGGLGSAAHDEHHREPSRTSMWRWAVPLIRPKGKVFLAGEARAYPAHLVARWHRNVFGSGSQSSANENGRTFSSNGRTRILTGPDNEGAGSNIQLLRFSSFSPLLFCLCDPLPGPLPSGSPPVLACEPCIPQFIANNNPLIFEQRFRIVAAFGVGVSQCQLYLSSSSSHKLVNRSRNQPRQQRTSPPSPSISLGSK
jgi:hypothetical protein